MNIEEIYNQIVREILNYKNVERVILFGSRAKGSQIDTSDIDIAVFAKDWTDTDINLVKDKIEVSVKTPLKIDLLNFYKLGKDSLKENILKGRVLYES